MKKTLCLMIFAVALPMVLAGCLTPEVPIAPPATPAQLAVIRSQFRRADPEARVGLVTAVLPSSHLTSVANVPVTDFTVGDVITFIDSNQNVLAMGHVETINQTSLTVRYDPPSPPGRNPVPGDIAVRAIH